MKKRQLKKHLFKGNCPVCLNDHKVSFLRLRGKGFKYFMRDQWVVVACDCGYTERNSN